MSDEIDEITNRSGGPRSTLGVYGRQDPEPAVVLLLRFNRGDGVIDTIRLAHSPAEARRLSDSSVQSPSRNIRVRSRGCARSRIGSIHPR
jgi:hypothetical protein